MKTRTKYNIETNKNIINRQINLKKGTNNMKKTKQETTTTAECSLLQ